MARLWNKDLMLSANTDAFDQRLREMRYNAASENRKQWADAVGTVASSLGDIGKAAYEDHQRYKRYKSIDDSDAAYKDDPVWIAAKNEYAKTGDSSKLHAVKAQFVAQQQAEANKALVEEEKARRLDGVKASLAGLKKQIEDPNIKTGEQLALITQYNTKAAENGLPEYSKEPPKVDTDVTKKKTDVSKDKTDVTKKKTDVSKDKTDVTKTDTIETLDADGTVDYLDADDTNPEQKTTMSDTEIENALTVGKDVTGDEKFDLDDIAYLIKMVNDDTNRTEADKTTILGKLTSKQEALTKQANDAILADLKNRKEMLTNEKPTDLTYANIDAIKSWNAKVDKYNQDLGDNAATVGTIAKLKLPEKPQPQASKQDVINWAKTNFASRLAKDKDFVTNNWQDIVESYNAKHQGKPYRGK